MVPHPGHARLPDNWLHVQTTACLGRGSASQHGYEVLMGCIGLLRTDRFTHCHLSFCSLAIDATQILHWTELETKRVIGKVLCLASFVYVYLVLIIFTVIESSFHAPKQLWMFIKMF